MEFSQLTHRAKEIRERYALYEQKHYGRNWTREEIAEGLVGDIGDLMKLVMAKKGIRTQDDVDQKLAHELADCLWSVLILADQYSIDLEKSFLQTMKDIEESLNE